MLAFIIALYALSWLMQISAILIAKRKARASLETTSISELIPQKLVGLTMLTPAIVLFVFIGLGHIELDWAALSFGLPTFFGIALGLAVPILYTFVAFCVLKRFADLKNFSIEKHEGGRWKLTAFNLLLDKRFPPPKKPIIYILDILLCIMLLTLFLSPLALGEELVWRGYMQPIFVEQFGIYGFILIGLIWGFWHLPLNLAGYNAPETSKLNAFVLFILQTISMSAIFGLLLIWTESIWSVVVAHAANNVLEGFLRTFLAPRISHPKFILIEVSVYVFFGTLAFGLIYLII